jgi:hypothetical protein
MIVRQRMQYFPEGGGAIGPVGIPPVAPRTTNAAGEPTFGLGGGDAPGTSGGIGGGTGGGAASTWGRVYPHFAQNNAPSMLIVPQWRQTVTRGAILMPYITVRYTVETPVGRTRHSGPGSLRRARGFLARTPASLGESPPRSTDPGPRRSGVDVARRGARNLPSSRARGRRGRGPTGARCGGRACPRGRRARGRSRRRDRPGTSTRLRGVRGVDLHRGRDPRLSGSGRHLFGSTAPPVRISPGGVPRGLGRPAATQSDREHVVDPPSLGGVGRRTRNHSPRSSEAPGRTRRSLDRAGRRSIGARTTPHEPHSRRDRQHPATEPRRERGPRDDLPVVRASRDSRRDLDGRGGRRHDLTAGRSPVPAPPGRQRTSSAGTPLTRPAVG